MESFQGWIDSIRDHKKILFVQLRLPNTQQMLQLVFHGEVLKQHRPDITIQACIYVKGDLVESDKSPTDGRELQVREMILSGKGSDDFRSELNADSETHALMEKRHMLHWTSIVDPTVQKCTRMKDCLERTISTMYGTLGFIKVSPPSIVDVETEGGSTLFKVNYYGDDRYLTQSGQLYLESVLPGYGNVWCLESSYRAEKSSTPRHLAEFKHLEAELSFVDMPALMRHVVVVVTSLLASMGVSEDKLQCREITHREAVDLLNELSFLTPNGKTYTYEDDLNDSAELRLLEVFKQPLLVTFFPADIKSFYMKKCPSDPALTESFDLLLPGVGETVGGSMRMTDYDELMAAFEKNAIDPKPYKWYTDTRKYGSCPHGGYGIGLERLIKAALYMRDEPIAHVRDACMFPLYYA
jgi:asparaginyl-tRNA synthetase